MDELHPNIVSYIKMMKSTKFWYADEGPKTFWNRCNTIYLQARRVLFLVLIVETSIGLYDLDTFGVINGTFIYLPLSVFLVVVNNLAYYSRKEHGRLVATLNKHFIESNEPWMITLSKNHTVPLWKYMWYIRLYDISTKVSYYFLPFIADTVLHYCFDMLEKPFCMPNFLTPWMPKDWCLRYYVLLFVGWWSMFELMDGLMGFMASYSALVTFVLIQVKIFKGKINAARFDGSKEEVDAVFRDLLAWHALNLQLNSDLKAYVGLPCAFLTLFGAFALTLCSFTAVASPIIAVKVGYVSGSVFYIFYNFLYNYLGQLLQDESDNIFDDLYKLPWYECSPDIRKSMNMIMRQSHRPLIIDYNGDYKMNFENYMQILSQSYSYFTILQSLTSSD